MKKVLILGHNGMLGNAVQKYLAHTGTYELLTLNTRWGDPLFEDSIRNLNPDIIINCIGLIPQKKPTAEQYQEVNVSLPLFLDTLGIAVIHPSTDCEFLGTIPPNESYTKSSVRDASDDYGKSKAQASERLEKNGNHTKIIRTSIIGHEQNTNVALLDWFLSQEGEVKGYTNHLWNGITTLEWAKQCEKLINNWETYPVLNQIGTELGRSKFDLLQDIKEVYGKEITIHPFATETAVNKTLESDAFVTSIKDQLRELKAFYNK